MSNIGQSPHKQSALSLTELSTIASKLFKRVLSSTTQALCIAVLRTAFLLPFRLSNLRTLESTSPPDEYSCLTRLTAFRLRLLQIDVELQHTESSPAVTICPEVL